MPSCSPRVLEVKRLREEMLLVLAEMKQKGNKISIFNYFHGFNKDEPLEKSLYPKLLLWPGNTATTHPPSFWGDANAVMKV